MEFCFIISQIVTLSNILIIKHGSLGDLIQANGAINDIKNNFPTEKKYVTILKDPEAVYEMISIGLYESLILRQGNQEVYNQILQNVPNAVIKRILPTRIPANSDASRLKPTAFIS